MFRLGDAFAAFAGGFDGQIKAHRHNPGTGRVGNLAVVSRRHRHRRIWPFARGDFRRLRGQQLRARLGQRRLVIKSGERECFKSQASCGPGTVTRFVSRNARNLPSVNVRASKAAAVFSGEMGCGWKVAQPATKTRMAGNIQHLTFNAQRARKCSNDARRTMDVRC